jgi:hypothetical protein
MFVTIKNTLMFRIQYMIEKRDADPSRDKEKPWQIFPFKFDSLVSSE